MMDDSTHHFTDDDVATAYREYAPALYAFFLQRTGNAHDAEDLLATTFSRALVSLERYEERGRFIAWLWSIARHVHGDAQRRRRVCVDVDAVAALLADPAPSPEAQALRAEQARHLHALLACLPTDQRAALLLRFFGEMSLAEIADVLGRSIGAVKMLLQRGMTTLREQYQESERFVDMIAALFRWRPALCYAPVPIVYSTR